MIKRVFGRQVVLLGVNHPVSALQESAQREARTDDDSAVRGEHILLALTSDADTAEARAMRAAGLDATAARERVRKAQPESEVVADMAFRERRWEWVRESGISDEDERVLDELGIDVAALHEAADESFGEGALKRKVTRLHRDRERLDPADRELGWPELFERAVALGLDRGAGDVTRQHLLEVVLRDCPHVLSRLTADERVTPERILEQLAGSAPGA